MSLFDQIHGTSYFKESVSDKKESILKKIEDACEEKGYTIKISKPSRECFISGKGSNGGGPSGPNSLCIAGMGKENYDNVYNLIKDIIKDEKEFSVTQDNYFTLFLDYKDGSKDENELSEESVNVYEAGKIKTGLKMARYAAIAYAGISTAIKLRHQEEFKKMEKLTEYYSLMSYFIPFSDLNKKLRNPITDIVVEYQYEGDTIFKYNTRYNKIIWIDSIYSKFKDFYEIEVQLNTLGDKLSNDIWMQINDLYYKIYGDEPYEEAVYPTYKNTSPFENWLMAGTRHPGNIKKHDVKIDIYQSGNTVQIVNNTSLEIFEPVTSSSDYNTCMKVLKNVIHKDFREYEYAFSFGKNVSNDARDMIPSLKDCILAESDWLKIKPTNDNTEYYSQIEMLIGNTTAIRNKVCKILKENGLGIEAFTSKHFVALYAMKFVGYTKESSNEEETSDVMNESLETFITKPLLPSKVRLYHGSEKELHEIQPISWNMGTRLSKVRASSYWFMNHTYAWQHAVQRMIFNSKEFKNGEFDELSPNNGIPVVNDYGANTLLVSYIPGNKASEKLLKKIYSTPVYVYAIDIDKKYIGRGQVGINNEYTIDIPVKPDAEIIVDPRRPGTKKFYDSYIQKVSPQLVDTVKLFDQKHKGRNLYNQIADRLVYHPLDDVYKKRHEFMNTYKNPSDVPKYAKVESVNNEIPKITNLVCFKGTNGCYNTIVNIDGYDKPLRAKSEVIIFDGKDNTSIFLRRVDKKGYYKLPGGTWDKNEDPKDAAIRETKEEARINIKNVNYVTTRIEPNIDQKKYTKDIPDDLKWDGYYCQIYTAEYDSPFTGHVDKVDEDRDLTYNGKFYPINEVYDKLRPEHKEAITNFLNSKGLSLNESVDENEIDSFIFESAGDTYVIKSKIYPIVEKTLSDPQKDKKFRNAVRSYIDRNSTDLHTSGPVNLVPFTDSDKEIFYNIFDTSKDQLIGPIDEMTKSINDKANWRLLRQNPIFCLFYECIRYYTIKKDKTGVNTALAIYALSVYPSVFAMLFQYGTNADVMKFTMDNLSAKYLMKQEGSVFGGLMKSIQNSYNFLKPNFIDSSDKEVVRFITRIRNDQKSLFKNIATQYYQNHQKGLRASTQSETYGDNQLIDDLMELI